MTSWKEENLGPESRKAHARRVREGFFDRYFGGVVLDIGYRGYEDLEVVPVLEDAIGIDLNYPGYDGKRLPFEDGTVDTVYASHTLEHIDEPLDAIREWFRVLKVGGHLVLAVPHQFLYEKRTARPSRWNGDHKRFYTPARLMAEVETALAPNSYRVRRLMDDDESYNYAIPPTQHAGGAYQIELVIEKILQPSWPLEVPENPLAEPENGGGPSLEDLNAKLGVIFTDLRGAVEMLSAEQDKASGRLAAIARQIGAARREWDAAGGLAAAEAPVLADYVRPDAVPLQDILTTTRFFRNRKQLKALLDQLRGSGAAAPPHVLVAGTSRGCEAYSLAIEAELAGLELSITAIDIDAENIAAASAGVYTFADFTDFDGTSLLAEEVTGYFLRNGDLIQVDPAALRNPPYFKVDDLFRHEGLYDAVICNNVLIHFSDATAERALARLDLLLSDGGILAVGGAPLDVLSGYMGARRTFAPIEAAREAIWEDWKGDRQSWELDPGSYVGMPPIDRTLPDWTFRFCTLFRKEGLGLRSSGQGPEELGRWLGGIEGALREVAQGQATISGSAHTVVEYLDDLLK